MNNFVIYETTIYPYAKRDFILFLSNYIIYIRESIAMFFSKDLSVKRHSYWKIFVGEGNE